MELLDPRSGLRRLWKLLQRSKIKVFAFFSIFMIVISTSFLMQNSVLKRYHLLVNRGQVGTSFLKIYRNVWQEITDQEVADANFAEFMQGPSKYVEHMCNHLP